MNSNVTSNVNQSILPCEEPLDISCRFKRMTENVRMNPDSLRPLIHPASDQYSPLPDGRVTITNSKISSTVTADMLNDPTFQALNVSDSRDPNNRKKTHKKVKVYFCDVCDSKGFRKKHDLVQHRISHIKEKAYSCEVCGKGFGSKGHLTQHRMVHGNRKIYFCEICGKGFRRNGHLTEHRIIHVAKKAYSCEVCDKEFKRKRGLKLHMKMHTEERLYPCSQCNQRFITRGRLNRHIKNHPKRERVEKEDKSCKICGKILAKNSSLKAHMLTHSKDKPYPCSLCDKRFGLKSSIKLHMRMHTGEKPYSCDICGKRFSQTSNLITHMNRYAAMGRPESSTASELLDGSKISSAATAGTSNDPTFQALSVSDLKSPNNQEKTDKNVQSHSCEVCDKTFTKQKNLQRHRKIHTRDKPYSCSICDKRFSQKSQFTIHMHLHHNKQKHAGLLKSGQPEK